MVSTIETVIDANMPPTTGEGIAAFFKNPIDLQRKSPMIRTINEIINVINSGTL